MNIITLTGNATKDLEVRHGGTGTVFASGSIAVRRDFKNQQGEYETDFFDFTAIGKTGEIMANHIKKGHKFGITGKLQNRNWEKDGQKHYKTEIIVTGFDFPYESRGNGAASSNQPPKQQSKVDNDPFTNNNGQIDISDDDLPF